MLKHETFHYTAILAYCADGKILLPSLVFKRKTLPKDKIPNDINFQVNPMGWMDEEGMELWLDEI